jgi:signal transduction histidine kinase
MRFYLSQTLLGCALMAGLLACMEAVCAETPAASVPVVLTNAAQVRNLTPDEAAKQLPIRLRGVVIENHFDGRLSIKDDTAGLYALASRTTAAEVQRGDLVEIEGVSNPGKFAPYVDVTALRKLGSGKVPAPQVADLEALFSGQLDAQWIEVSGIVRRVNPVWGGLDFEMNIEPGGGRVLVHADGFGLMATVDSAVRLRAVCYYQFNASRQVLRPYLSVPSGEPIEVIKPAMTNLNALPVRSIESLMQFSVGQNGAHRVRVRGVVTYSQPGDGFWIHDATRGLRVLSDGNDPLPIGTEVDVFGFLKRGDYGPLLEDAMARKTGRIQPVNPTCLTNAVEALNHDADLIECEATVQAQERILDGICLKLSDGATDFRAVLAVLEGKDSRLSLVPGARVRVTGVCTVGFRTESTFPGTLEPQFFQIMLRSPADVVVLELPSWWTAEHVGWLTASVMGFLLAVGAVFFWVHRRRVARQMAAMKAQAALAAERSRIARDLHDEIGSNLTHISILSTLASKSVSEQPQNAQQHCVEAALAAQQTIRAFDEILWSVNPKNDTLHSLSHYICRYAEETLAPAGIACRFELNESFPNLLLPPNCRHGLLLAVKEAIHNIVKHAAAKKVEIKCGMESDRVFLVRVNDDGCGMASRISTPGSIKREGLGMENLRRRLAELGGTCEIESKAEQGTRVTLRLPL